MNNTTTAENGLGFISPSTRTFSILEKAKGASASIRIDGTLPIGSLFPTMWGKLRVIGNYVETYETAETEPYGV